MISNIDIGIIIGYFVLVVLIGFWVATRTKSEDDLFLGGRSLTWGFIGLSLFASNISSTTLIGLAGSAYSTGIVQSVYEWSMGIPFILMAFIFIPLYLKSKITTIPEFLELRYDRRSRIFFSIVTIFISIVVDTAGGLYAGALVLKVFFPDLILWQTSVLLALFAGLYTAFGGLKAVVYTDAIQAIILIIGCSTLTYILFQNLDFSIDTVIQSAPEGHFSVVKSLSDESLPWPGLLLGVPFLGFWYMATNQYITQRVLGAKNMQHARWGVMLAGALKLLPFFIMVIPGALAISQFPNLDNPDLVFPTTVLEVLPIGMVGIVLAGLISAIMSTVDSTLNSASTLIVVDFIKPANPNISQEKVVEYGRIATFILMIVAALWSPLIAQFEGLWSYLQQMFAIIVPPIVVIFLLGTFYKRGNGDGAFLTLILGTAIGVLLFILGQFDMWPLHYTINVGLVVAISSIIFVVVSNQTEAPDPEKIRLYTYRKELIQMENEGLPWYKDYRYHSAVLFAIIMIILYILW
ncbi:MAG: sodium:solute symporter [Bacteroidia bacterium]|nr:sodium:solute symporter [Bacteroidia bacterium]